MMEMVCTFIKTREKRSIKIQLGHGKSLWDSARLISLLGAVMAGRDRCPPGLAWLPTHPGSHARWQFQFRRAYSPHFQQIGAGWRCSNAYK